MPPQKKCVKIKKSDPHEQRPHLAALFRACALVTTLLVLAPGRLVADVTVFTGLPNNRGPAIVRSTNGTLLAFCNGIYLKRSADNGATWGPLITVGATGNPVPVVDETTGRIHLLTSNSYYTYSDDDGLTWSPPR